MGFRLFSLTGTIDAETKPLDRALSGSRRSLAGLGSFASRVSAGISRSFERAGRSIGGLANGIRSATSGTRGLYAALSLAAGTALGLDLLKKAVMGASDLNESLSKTGTVFLDSTGVVTSAANEMAKKFGIVKSTFMDSASAIGLVGKASGLTANEAAHLGVSLSKLALDASSFFNVPLDEALIAMRAGLVGESEPLRRFGVLLSEAAVQDEALRLGLVKSKKEMNEGTKVRARASIITRQLADASGDLERTSAGMANTLKRVGGQFQNILISIGGKLLPIFVNLANSIGTLLGQFDAYLDENGHRLANWAAGVAKAAGLVTLVWEQWPKFVELAVLKVREFLMQMAERISRVGRTMWEALTYGATTAVTVLKNLFGGLATYLTTLFESIAGNLTASLTNALIDFANGPIKSILPMLAAINPGAAAGLMAFGSGPRQVGPKVQGDASGLTGPAIMKGVKDRPDFLAKFDEPLKDLDHLIRPILDALHGINAATVLGNKLKAAPQALAGIMKRPLSPVEQLNKDNRRLLNGRPEIKGRDRQSQEQAERTLRFRREREAKAMADYEGRLARRNFGQAGVLGATLKRGAEMLGSKLGLSARLSGAIGSGAALLAGGMPGLLGANQQGAADRVRGRRRLAGNGLAGIKPPDEDFKSEFVGLAEYSRKIAADAMSTQKGAKDKQVDLLSQIADGIGYRSSSADNSVIGLLQGLKKAGGGPGFAVGPA